MTAKTPLYSVTINGEQFLFTTWTIHSAIKKALRASGFYYPRRYLAIKEGTLDIQVVRVVRVKT
jgi:hypothetical protein